MKTDSTEDRMVDEDTSDAGGDEIREHRTVRWRRGTSSEVEEQIAVEEPLEIRLAGRRFTLTMRTPGHDEDLAAGFLFAEGFINDASELDEIRRVRGRKGAPDPNAIDIILNVPAEGLRARLKRNFVISSSCGVCGKPASTRFYAASRPPRIPRASNRPRCWRCRKSCAQASACSRRREDCTAQRSSRSTARCSLSVKTSAVTTPSTRSSGTR
jgi:formate dehydrogenase assembly factor FdhD